jgi:hypothetical protein
MVLWPTTIQSLAKYEAAALAIVIFFFNFRQSSLKRKGDYNAALSNWANGAIDQLLMLKFGDPKDRPCTLLKLKVTIDQGRLFFPNKRVRGMAYGWRPRLLDWLRYSEKLIEIQPILIDVQEVSERDELLEGLRRRFIEDVQLILAPTSFFQMAPILRLQIMVWRGSDAMETSQKFDPIPSAQAFLNRHESKR